jgi:hypothetical protein
LIQYRVIPKFWRSILRPADTETNLYIYYFEQQKLVFYISVCFSVLVTRIENNLRALS